MDRILPRNAFAISLLAFGIIFAASPYVIGFSEEPRAAASALAIGGLMALIAGAAGLLLKHSADEAALTLGAWSLVAPFVIGFADRPEALWGHLAAGVAAMLLGIAAADWRARHPPAASG
jgi:hypothetical protein